MEVVQYSVEVSGVSHDILVSVCRECSHVLIMHSVLSKGFVTNVVFSNKAADSLQPTNEVSE